MNILAGLPESPISPEAEQGFAAIAVSESRIYADREKSREIIVLHSIRQSFDYAKRLSRGKLPDDEVLSLAYSALSKSILNFKPGSQSFLNYSKAYIRGEISAVWRAKDVVRNAYRHADPIDSDEIPGAPPAPLEPDIVNPEFNNIHWRELWHELEPLLREKLSKRQLLILEQHYRFGKSFQSVGDELGITREAVRASHSKSLRKIRNELLDQRRLYADE